MTKTPLAKRIRIGPRTRLSIRGVIRLVNDAAMSVPPRVTKLHLSAACVVATILGESGSRPFRNLTAFRTAQLIERIATRLEHGSTIARVHDELALELGLLR